MSRGAAEESFAAPRLIVRLLIKPRPSAVATFLRRSAAAFFPVAPTPTTWILRRHETPNICNRAFGIAAFRLLFCRATIRFRFRSGYGRDASESGASRLADVAPHPQRLGLQSAGPNQSHERSQFEDGLDPRYGAGRSGGDAACVSGRDVFAQPKRSDSGDECGD